MSTSRTIKRYYTNSLPLRWLWKWHSLSSMELAARACGPNNLLPIIPQWLGQLSVRSTLPIAHGDIPCQRNPCYPQASLLFFHLGILCCWRWSTTSCSRWYRSQCACSPRPQHEEGCHVCSCWIHIPETKQRNLESQKCEDGLYLRFEHFFFRTVAKRFVLKRLNV